MFARAHLQVRSSQYRIFSRSTCWFPHIFRLPCNRIFSEGEIVICQSERWYKFLDQWQAEDVKSPPIRDGGWVCQIVSANQGQGMGPPDSLHQWEARDEATRVSCFNGNHISAAATKLPPHVTKEHILIKCWVFKKSCALKKTIVLYYVTKKRLHFKDLHIILPAHKMCVWSPLEELEW